jgi:hypothetical protein
MFYYLSTVFNKNSLHTDTIKWHIGCGWLVYWLHGATVQKTAIFADTLVFKILKLVRNNSVKIYIFTCLFI